MAPAMASQATLLNIEDHIIPVSLFYVGWSWFFIPNSELNFMHISNSSFGILEILDHLISGFLENSNHLLTIHLILLGIIVEFFEDHLEICREMFNI